MKPRTELSGVLSSWLIFARNWDLWRLAASSSRPFSSISRNSLAFWMASTDCAAKVSIRWTTCSIEFARFAAPDDQRADDLVRPEQRNDQDAAISGIENDFRTRETAVLR